MDDSVSVAPATAADVRAAYGSVPVSVRAWKASIGGETIGIGGAIFAPRPNVPTAFLNVLRPDAPKKSIYKAIVEGLRLIRSECGAPLYVLRDCGKAGSESLLRRLGFEPRSEDRDGKEIWEWGRR